MVEGLTFFSTVQGTDALRECTQGTRRNRSSSIGASGRTCAVLPRDAADPQSTHEILVTLAERPHPFPSRTRKLSSPAPKILRGQPFGKIGRRQDFCVPPGFMDHDSLLRLTPGDAHAR